MLKHLGERRLDFLDQTRAIAILPVVITHYHTTWLPGGGMGVGIFFALSGFLITSLLLEEPVLNRRAVARFYIRRIMRIYPLYVLAIAGTVLFTFFLAPQKFNTVAHSVPGLLTFLQNPPMTGLFSFGVLWTLQVEAWFYITLPLVMLLFGKKPGTLVFCLVLLVAAPTSFFFPASAVLLHWGAALAFGALISLAWKAGWLSQTNISPMQLAGVGLVAVIILLAPGPEPRTHWYIEVMAASIAGASLITAFLLQPNLPVWRPMPFIGRISYSMYLMHAMVIDFVTPFVEASPAPRLSRPAIFVTLIICLSYLTYRAVERPGIQLGKQLIAMSRAQRATRDAA